MGGCSSCCSKPKTEKPDEDYHVGCENVGKATKRQNSKFQPYVLDDDQIIKEYMSTAQGALGWLCCCCPESCTVLAKMMSNDPKQLSHFNTWEPAYSKVKTDACCCGCGCGCMQQMACPFYAAKEMRLIALNASIEDAQAASSTYSFICCGTDQKLLENYECCQVCQVPVLLLYKQLMAKCELQGYQDNHCIKPSSRCSCLKGSECGLNIEVCLFPNTSITSTMEYFEDTRDIQPDPELAQHRKLLDLMKQMAKCVKHLESASGLSSGPVTQPAHRCMMLVVALFHRMELVTFRAQIQQCAANRPFISHQLQGRHRENTTNKMVHRYLASKEYLVKVLAKLVCSDIHRKKKIV